MNRTCLNSFTKIHELKIGISQNDSYDTDSNRNQPRIKKTISFRVIERMKTTLLPIFVLVILFGCNNYMRTPMMKNASGRAGEMVVVIPDEYRKGELGELVMSTLAQPQLGLPAEEPIFDVTQIPVEGFGDIFRTTRNLLIFTISTSITKNEVTFQKDVYSSQQALISIKANNAKVAKDLFNNNSDKILTYFLTFERNRLIYSYTRIYEKSVNKAVKEKFGIDIHVVPGAVITETKDDFMGILFDTPDITQGIAIYTYPYDSDSTFTKNYLREKRNEFMKNVVGSVDGSYMTTDNLPILFQTLKKDGNYIGDIRGLFKMENDFMGGPFINLSILDLLHKRVIVLDGFVYAPKLNKRNLLRQVEAMIYSVKFEQQEEMDKINKQFEL